MKNIILAANWKMNGLLATNEALIKDLKGFYASSVQVVICPPYPYLAQVFSLLSTTNVKLGAQDVSEFVAGAYTGQVSSKQLKDLKCDYVIVGHSECRIWRNENDELIARKIKITLDHGMTPILCIGESANDRTCGLTFAVIQAQLDQIINLLGVERFSDIIIAYEPVWAIGTGLVATPTQVGEVHAFIKDYLHRPPRLKILYGGSVKADNAAQLLGLKDVDGALIGGASLNSDEFLKICDKAARIT